MHAYDMREMFVRGQARPVPRGRASALPNFWGVLTPIRCDVYRMTKFGVV